MLHTIGSAILGAATFLASLFGVTPNLGAQLPSATAVFETSLAARISATDTSMTLVANSVRGGGTLSGFECFTIDEGRSDAENVCGSISGTTVTSLIRGLDLQTATTSNSSLKFAHRVGANVKITDFPVLQIIRNQAAGTDTYSNTLRYASGVTPSNTGDLTDKEYVDDIAFNGAGVINASSVAKGVVELATGCEVASSTSSGDSGTLAIPAGLASSTRTSSTLGACKVVVANNNGVIDDNWIATSTLFATSSIATGPIGMVGKNAQVFSSTGTTTWSRPAGIIKIKVTTVGAGGAGGSADPTSTDESGGGGGGGGGCAIEWLDVSGSSTIQVFVGTGGSGNAGAAGSAGTWSTFGTNGFYNSASGGAGGGYDTGPYGGSGGIGTGGTLNLKGSGGGAGSPNFAGTGVSGAGGNSCMGGGGLGAAVSSGSPGSTGGDYGGGGGGAPGANGTANTGGAGANGLVLVEW